jgi:pyrimidine operon attenuation protein/uracil phosphoribosyltransferase
MPTVEQLLDAMAERLRTRLQALGRSDVAMIGIHTGGVWIARELHRRLALDQPLGELDISFYRDDFSRIGMHPQVKPSKLPFKVDNRHIVLVDDVLYTGRTVRAAMNEVFDFGRPASVLLVALVERPGRELPIEAEVVGQHVDIGARQQVRLSGPEPLELAIVDLDAEAGA